VALTESLQSGQLDLGASVSIHVWLPRDQLFADDVADISQLLPPYLSHSQNHSNVLTRPLIAKAYLFYAMILGPISGLDCVVFLILLTPQLILQAGFIPTVICALQALPFLRRSIYLILYRVMKFKTVSHRKRVYSPAFV
jgi:hypothetical protein